ncbi:testis expressed protein 56-like [Paroedura picta]|uniref:testis expressed protein 56-like n=1 Tax=Paroedura picta TaxID=143630 RepID=UPI0010147CF3
MPLRKLSSWCQRTRKMGPVITPATRSSLNLPPLVTYQKLKRSDNDADINRVFLKISALHCKLHDPLKERLLWCACGDEGRHDETSFAMFAANRELPQEVYNSPKPDHVPLKHRTYSNKMADTYKGSGTYRRDAPMATVIARWTPNSISGQHDQQSTVQELAKFGDIESVTSFGRQTIVVVFKEIRSACKAIRAFPPRGPNQNLQCVWHHKFMSKYKRDRNLRWPPLMA